MVVSYFFIACQAFGIISILADDLANPDACQTKDHIALLTGAFWCVVKDLAKRNKDLAESFPTKKPNAVVLLAAVRESLRNFSNAYQARLSK